jgi:hypothetical protein
MNLYGVQTALSSGLLLGEMGCTEDQPAFSWQGLPGDASS